MTAASDHIYANDTILPIGKGVFARINHKLDDDETETLADAYGQPPLTSRLPSSPSSVSSAVRSKHDDRSDRGTSADVQDRGRELRARGQPSPAAPWAP